MIIDVSARYPKYTITLPISKNKVEFRPFTVKEEKLLLLAQEDDSTEVTINSIGQIISNCTFGKFTIDVLNKTDAEFLFIHIRNKSKGEGVEIRAICTECQHPMPMVLDFDQIVVKNADVKFEPLQILDDAWVTMKYPTLKESLSLESGDGIDAIAASLDTIIDGESVKNASDYTKEERIEFIESLTIAQVQNISKFFDKFPSIEFDIKYNCKCGHENKVHIEGVENFFA